MVSDLRSGVLILKPLLYALQKRKGENFFAFFIVMTAPYSHFLYQY